MTDLDSVLIGDSVPMQRLKMMIAAVAPSRLSVLVEGATGTGKELVAALLHRESRRDGALVPFNVCAIADSMFEDALFGHVKGAYTGAGGETLGFLREANGGTAFFDEISALPLASQAKLLRAIETGVVRPIGSSRDARSDFRVVSATNERIDDLVDSGRFRPDLAHRLSGIVIAVPSLEERIDDIPMLVGHFIRLARPARATTVSRGALQALRERCWKGNVRELKQVVDAALVFSRDVLDVDALDLVFAQRARKSDLTVQAPAAIERQRLLKLLMSESWDTEAAAAALGVHRTTIYRRMRRLGIPVPSTGELRAIAGSPTDTLRTLVNRAAVGGTESRALSEARANATA
jgi:DNA-binding NtrC family response regulator